ncbi:hypothetical protein HYH03_014461 [Edaphochlamys debaryana]|uniref:BTB domain-containing protein n=1 Tax=Edaphochlamys debaryana TaxID=47281 RepID=A0A835XW94_9CHLO|nr:hypothetical protein HYH03_014461 [Edaphochlamys debaryana]|eukprot:KAG2486964.1 hypothetical protein HYH03_014461 [Edaphochlamys debaryana]
MRFEVIHGLVADGRGNLWVLDLGMVRRVDITTCQVSSLPGTQRPERWRALAFDATSGTLLAATARAVCRVHTEGGGIVELLAGELSQPGQAQPPSDDEDEQRPSNAIDGDCTTARFAKIALLLPLPSGRLLIADGRDLRCLNAATGGGGGAVRTLLRGCFLAKGAQHMAVLPYGDLGVLYGSVEDDCSLDLRLVPAAVFSAGAPSPRPATAQPPLSDPLSTPPTFTVRVAGVPFSVRPSVLTTTSAYFARLLAPGGGFANSGAAEAALPYTDPETFAHLLQLMLCACARLPCIPAHHLPVHIRHPVITLAQQLLIDGPVWEALSAGLVQSAGPDTALSDLLLAEAHGMAEAAKGLRVYVIEHRRSVDLGLLDELVERDPGGTVTLVKQLFRGPRPCPWGGGY